MKKALIGFLFLFAPLAVADTVTYSATATTGTATVTMAFSPNWTSGDKGATAVYTITCVSSTLGNVTIALPPIDGVLARVVTNPGSTAPTDNWDFVLTDVDGLDVCGGGGANRDTANTEQFAPLISTYAPTVISGVHTLAVTNAGDSKTLVIKLYVRR